MRKLSSKAKRQMRRVKFEPPLFPVHQKPNGNLDPTREAHGLWYYYLTARREYERFTGQQVVLVTASETYTPTPEPNWRQMFERTAEIYGVVPEHMAKCWQQVDLECLRIGLPTMPHEEKYRFDGPIVIN